LVSFSVTTVKQQGLAACAAAYKPPILDVRNQMGNPATVGEAMAQQDDRSAPHSTALLHAIVESLPLRVYACDTAGRIILQNSMSMQDFGNTIGRYAEDFLHDKDILAHWRRNVQRALSGESVWDMLRMPMPGGPRDYRFLIAPIRDGGKILGIVGVDIDITEQLQVERALRESESLYRLLAENSSDVISRHTPTGEWLFLSPAAKTLLDMEPADLVGHSPFELIHPDDQARTAATLAALIETRQPQSVTFRVRRADGRYIWSETDGRAVLDAATGELVELVTTSRDVTERIEADRKLRLREAELAHAGRLSTMGQMATEIAHEMNQPLYAIANFADASLTLAKNLPGAGDTNLVRWLELIAQQARRAGDVLRRITRFVRKGELNPEPIDLNGVVRDVLAMLDFEIKQQAIEVISDLTEPLPAVQADRLLMEQVLVNLVRNAIEALTGARTSERTLAITTRDTAEGVMLSVADNGPGLSGEQLAQAFEPYFTTKDDGTGLGLAICRSTIEAHGGKISARNNQDGGATFEIVLPPIARDTVPVTFIPEPNIPVPAQSS
jgi:PAS domain S-box-containing protein